MTLATQIVPILALSLAGSAPAPTAGIYPLFLSDSGRLEALDARIARETFHGCSSVRIEPAMGPNNPAGNALVILPGPPFHDGVIELSVAGEVAAGADPGSRGFTGVAFRVQPHGAAYEAFYLRPTNGRAEDQLRRNHSLQYIAEPEFPWERLRQETPGQYESYHDLQPGMWTRMRIVVDGVKARLFINDASQPALIVNDLKHGDRSGAVALWVGPGSIGHFCAASGSSH